MTDLPRTPTFQLNGKRALVTGASRGIGLGGAMALADVVRRNIEALNIPHEYANGDRIVTTSWDNTAKVWDAQTGALIASLDNHTSDVESAAVRLASERFRQLACPALERVPFLRQIKNPFFDPR